jgi:hypothetical protein
MSESIQAMQVKAQDPVAPTMPEMPEFSDPFQAMLWVIYVQMPAALDVKQYGLGSLSTMLTRVSQYQDKLTKAQTGINEMYDVLGWSDAQMIEKTKEIVGDIQALRNAVADEDVLSGSLKTDTLKYLDRFILDVTSDPYYNAGYTFPYMWHYAASDDAHFGDRYRTDLRERLNELDIVGSSFKSTSSQTQALYQYDTEDYKAWVGLTQKIMMEFFDQVGAPIRESLNVK